MPLLWKWHFLFFIIIRQQIFLALFAKAMYNDIAIIAFANNTSVLEAAV